MMPAVSMTPAVEVARPTPRPPVIYVEVPTARPTRGVGVEVAIPTSPEFVTRKFVADEEPTTNEGPVPVPYASTVRNPHGEVVPLLILLLTPTNPVGVIVNGS